MPEAAYARARQVLAEARRRLLPWGADQAVLLLEPHLDTDEVESLLRRMRSGSYVDDLLEQSGERRPELAFAALRSAGGFGAAAAVRRLGWRARSLLLAQLRTRPWTFSLRRDPSIDEILGANELRLAAERSMRLATDARDILEALALLPGDEPTAPLRRLVLRVNRLRRDADESLRVRFWNCLCRTEHLVRLLDRDIVSAALDDESLDTVNRVLLLRAHPGVDHGKAKLMWKQAGLLPRLALDVLRATGPAQRRLADEALRRAPEARVDNAQAARTAAAIVSTGRDGESLEAVARLAADPDLPATVRAVAWFVTGTDPAGDRVGSRYRKWYKTRGGSHSEPLIDLLSGAWQAQVLL